MHTENMPTCDLQFTGPVLFDTKIWTIYNFWTVQSSLHESPRCTVSTWKFLRVLMSVKCFRVLEFISLPYIHFLINLQFSNCPIKSTWISDVYNVNVQLSPRPYVCQCKLLNWHTLDNLCCSLENKNGNHRPPFVPVSFSKNSVDIFLTLWSS